MNQAGAYRFKQQATQQCDVEMLQIWRVQGVGDRLLNFQQGEWRGIK